MLNNRFLLSLSATAFILHTVVNATTAYGYFRDEFYYLACGEHLAFGYVDQPPLSILILAINRFLFGDSLVAFRVLPALAHAAVVFLTGRLTRELGGTSFAQTLAALCALTTPVYLAIMGYYSMNAFDILFWTIAISIVLAIVKGGNKNLWIWFGIIIGLGAQNKYSILFLCFGIAIGMTFTGGLKHLRSKELWIGAVLSALIFLPHIIWQVVNGFPTAEFIRNATLYKNVASTPFEFLTAQILQMSPFMLPVWGLGLWFFFFSTTGKQFRLFGWCYAAIFTLFVLQRGKAYYLAPIYPILLAGGAVLIGQFIYKRKMDWLKPVILGILNLTAIFVSPMAVPILPVETFIAYQRAIHMEAPREERHEMGRLPQHYADMFGWEEKVAAVARAFKRLTPGEKSKCAIVADNYGRAGAIDFFGIKYGLPKAISRHNNYWLWGTRGYTGEVVIVLGGDEEDKQQLFETVEVTETVQCEYCMPYENNLRVFVCRGIKVPIDQLWSKYKSFN